MGLNVCGYSVTDHMFQWFHTFYRSHYISELIYGDSLTLWLQTQWGKLKLEDDRFHSLKSLLTKA